MKQRHLLPVLLPVLFSLILACGQPGTTTTYRVPVEYYKLDNGLRVVLSTDTTAPIVTVAVYYNIGFRIEPQDRTGFAHLFEHMMFQGSENLGKMEFIRLVQRNGGVLNGSTRFDFTNYFEILPAHKLETALWAEADRMGGLAITQENLTNQQGVVVNEINQALHNEPYGGFPWLDLPQYANVNWYNAHNFYGDIDDIKAANLQDVQDFFKTFYAPNNTVLVITGDFVPAEAKVMVQKYFGPIPAVEQPQPVDLTEPRQENEKVFSKDDRLATKPALAFAYHMPEKNSPQYYAMGLLDQLLLQGEDSRLYQALAKRKGFTDSVDGGINGLLGNMYNYNGPMLWFASLIYDNNVSSDSIMAAVNEVIEEVRTNPIDQATFDHIYTKLQSSLYNEIDDYFGFGRADLLASFALFDDDPARINTLEDHFKAVTPQLLLETAQEYLRPGNRTVLTINPKAN